MSESTNPYLRGGGEMGYRTRQYNWQDSALGDPGQWPQALLTTVSIILNAKFPMFLWWGKDLIQFYNDAYRPSLGVDGKHPTALGQKGVDCWPEIWPVISPLIAQVMSGGEATWMEDSLIPIYRNGQLEDVYWTFSYSHVFDPGGGPGGVLVICTETTDKVKSRRQLEKMIVNSGIIEQRLRYMLEEAPLPIAIVTGRELIIESANKQMLDIWGKSADIVGLALAEALPELINQPFLGILDDVYTTGTPFYGNEMRVMLERKGQLEEVYTNFVYYPLKGPVDNTNSIMLVATIITEQVKARKELEQSRDTLQLAFSAAEVGFFDLDFEKDLLEWDERCRELFGVTHTGPVYYERDFVQGLHPDDRDRVLAIIAGVLDKHSGMDNYDVEYRTAGKDNILPRWIRARGKVYFNTNDEPQRFTGVVIDITADKLLERKKNDFISMMSHELKTPLTSLKGYLQLGRANYQGAGDDFIQKCLANSQRQVDKISGMVNGFLNIARLKTGRMALHKTSFELGVLVQESVDEIKMITQHTDIEIKKSGSFTIVADYEKIGQVLNNLLTNAIKYSPKNAPVTVFYHPSEEGMIVGVRDKGMGVSAEDQQKIFDRFYRSDVAEQQFIPGFGIGLYFCAEIIKQHGGRIWAENNCDEGASFYFTVPQDIPGRS